MHRCSPRSKDEPWSIAEDGQRNLWLGSDIGLVRYSDDSTTLFNTRNGLPDGEVSVVYADRQDRLWLGMRQGGLIRFENGRFTSIPELEDRKVRAIHQDRSGTLWFGCMLGGVFLFEGGQYTALPDPDGRLSYTIASLHEDEQGSLWMAAWGGGLVRWQEGTLTSYRQQDGLCTDTASWILEDDQGNLWVSSDHGIYRVNRNQIEDYDAGQIEKIPCTSYSLDDGRKSLETYTRGFPSGWKTNDGRLWFTMLPGVAAVGPEELFNPFPPPVLIESVLVDDRAVQNNELASIAPGRRDLEIDFTATSLRAPEKVQFKYQLVGYDDDWVDAGNRRAAYYTHVPPGTFQFRVKAANESGVWNEEGATHSFTFLPYFYETLWFRALSVLLLGALLYSAHRWSAGRAEKRARELENLVQARDVKEKELRKSEARFRAFMDHNPAAIYLKDETGKQTYGNSTILSLFGITLDQFVGTTIHDFFPAEVSEQVEAADQVVLTHQEAMEVPEYSESSKGRKRWWKDFKFPVPLSEGGTVLGGNALDVTSRKNAELELQKAYEEIRDLKDRLERENVYLRKEIRTGPHFEDIVGDSQGLKQAIHKVEQVAATDTTVLILGETDTGKKLIARAIHKRSARRDHSLVRVNCAALPPTLIESELFGHERGAFTGAAARRRGRSELAHGGTIFLDEIGDLDPSLQTKLFRVLQEGELERVGGTKTLKVDVRVITATHRNIQKAVQEEYFRSDLYYRLNVFPIEIPPLRERRDDISLLVWYYVNRHASMLGKNIKKISQPLMDAFLRYDWPGNVRELENLIERAVILSPGPVLQIDEPLGVGTLGLEEERFAGAGVSPSTSDSAPSRSLEEVERAHILNVLEECAWKVAGERGAAEKHGLKESTLRKRMQKLEIRRPTGFARNRTSGPHK